MQLNQLIYFLEVVEARSISKAAQKLHISQPSLSITIKNLEEELGQPLFKRTKYGVIPTELGLTVYSDFLAFKKNMDQWYCQKSEPSQCTTGSIHLSVMPSASQYFFENLIFPFNEIYPNIKFYLYNVFPQTLVDNLENSASNIAVLSIPANLREQILEHIDKKGWRYNHILTDERVLCIGSTHPLAQKDSLDLEDLKTLSLVYHSVKNDVISKMYEKYFASSYRVASYGDILSFMKQNKAVFLPSRKVSALDEEVNNGTFKFFKIPVTEINNEVYIYAISNNSLSSCEENFYTYLLDYFKKI